MPLAPNNLIQVSAVGESDHITTPAGDHVLLVTSSNWSGSQSTTLQVGDGVAFADAKDEAGNKIVMTENSAPVVPGGLSYRLRTTSYTSQILCKPMAIPSRS